MAEKGKNNNKKTRGVSAHAIQKSKTSTMRKTATKKTTAKKTAPKMPEAKIKTEAKADAKTESVFEQFETLKITRTESPRESKIITRDVAKEKPFYGTNITPKANTVPKVATTSKITMAPKPTTGPKVAAVRKSTTPKITPQKPTAREIKEYEIKKALNNASRLPEVKEKQDRKRFSLSNISIIRLVLGIACLSTAIFAVVYFVNLTSSDMSLKVAAMQSGIDAKYPSYIPRGYILSDVTSSSGIVTMHFKDGDNKFCIIEENSSWDSNALLNNYIKKNYGDEYTVVREQGLTLYMGDSWEVWVNGGMLYKLSVESGELTKKQMKTIATSL